MSGDPAELLAALGEALAEHPGAYALIGANARNAWAPPRATTDLDLAIAADATVLGIVQGTFEAHGYEAVRTHRADPDDTLADLVVLRSAKGSPRQIDLLVAKTAFEAEVLERSVPVEMGGVRVAVATPEDLIVYKLIAHRPRDREDIDAIRRTQARSGRPLDRAYIERWARFWGVADRLASLEPDEP